MNYYMYVYLEIYKFKTIYIVKMGQMHESVFSREATLESAMSVRCLSVMPFQCEASKSSVKIKCQNQASKSSVKFKRQNIALWLS